jgi:hypothetical protein
LAVPTSISLLTAALPWRGETSVEVFDLTAKQSRCFSADWV